MLRRPTCERTPEKVKYLDAEGARRAIVRHWQVALRRQGHLTEKDKRSRPYECGYADGCGYWHTTTAQYGHDEDRHTPPEGVRFTPQDDRETPYEEADVASIEAKITKEDADGSPLAAKVTRRVIHNSHVRHESVGYARYVGFDGLVEEYAVFAGSHQVGTIERRGVSVTPYPDLDDVYEALFTALVRVL